MRQTNALLMEKIKESLTSVLPITAIVLVLCFTITPISNSTLMAFVIGAALLIIGMGLFTLGADMAMSPMGEHIGAAITRKRKIWIIVIGCFIIGMLITISEPDLAVLAEQVPQVPNMTLTLAVAVGVGIFLVIALLRILFSIRLSYLLIGAYILVFGLSFFVPRDFLAIAFDSGGVTTGPMTVPFIMALGVGVASIRSDKHAQNDSFGLVALCSVGPILAVMVLGLIYDVQGSVPPETVVPPVANSQELWGLFSAGLPKYILEVMIALLPIFAMFIFFQLVTLKLPRREMLKMIIGVVYTYVGLVLFLTGVNVGFLPVGKELGQALAGLDYNWILVPIGMLMGYFMVAAEPAVHVLNKQVEEVTAGAIPGKALSLSLGIGVAVSVGLAMIRVLTGISIYWFLVPGYAIALILACIVPRIFTSIAFDSGGVASGPMATTFMLPLAMGASSALGGTVVTDAFGLVAMVAMTPLITIQILGLVFQRKQARMPVADTSDDSDVIELDGEDNEGYISGDESPAYISDRHEGRVTETEVIELGGSEV